MDTLACNETENWALLGLVIYPVRYKPTSNQTQALESSAAFAGLAWASDYCTSVTVELLLIFSGQNDKGAMPKCHKSPVKKAVTECLASKYLCTATRDFKLLCLLLLTTTLRAGKINGCVSLGPSLIWKPETNIETLKSPNASFPINYQWLHLSLRAAEGSNVRPGYFRALSSQPWARLCENSSACVVHYPTWKLQLPSSYSSLPSQH